MNEQRYRMAEQRLWSGLGLTPTERTVTGARTGATVRVQEIGTGPPILFIHGASNGGASWAPLAAGLPGFRCLLVDRPGCALSPAVPRPSRDLRTLEALADDLLVDLLDEVDIERAGIVATSYGGFFAFRSAAAHPDRFDRIMEFGWSFGAPAERVPFVMRFAAVPGLRMLLTKVPPTDRSVRMMLRSIGLRSAIDSGRIEDAVAWFLALQRDTDTMANELRSGPPVFRPIRGLDEACLLPRELLARVSVPVRFVWGEDDPLGGRAIAQAFSEMLPRAELEMWQGTGHAPWMDDPDRAAASARAFFAMPADGASGDAAPQA